MRRPPYPGQGGFSTSPVLVDLDGGGKDLRLVACANQMFRCLDADTGSELWALPYLAAIGQAMGVPAVARVDGEAVVIGTGSEGWKEQPGDEIIRVRDGKSVGFVPGTGTGKGAGNGPIAIDGNLVVAWAGVERAGWTLAAWRLRWNADWSRIEADEVWRQEAPRGFNPLWRGA